MTWPSSYSQSSIITPNQKVSRLSAFESLGISAGSKRSPDSDNVRSLGSRPSPDSDNLRSFESRSSPDTSRPLLSSGTVRSASASPKKSEGFSNHPLITNHPEVERTMSTRTASFSCPIESNMAYRSLSRPVHSGSPKDLLLEDNIGELELVDTRKLSSRDIGSQQLSRMDELPSKITGTYNENYNILYVDEIIRKKLQQEKFTHLQGLKYRYKSLQEVCSKPQTYIMREKTLGEMRKIQDEITQIETGEKSRIYDERVRNILQEYRKCGNQVKTVIFDFEEEDRYEEFDDDVRYRLSLIDRYLDIAAQYIEIDITRINNRPADICAGCGISLAKIATDEFDVQRCPNCQTEHNMINLAKMSKDGARINTSSTNEDESIDNFIRTFMRYQGLQPDRPDESLYDELDAYFIRSDRPIGEEIRQLPLNERGRRADTDHKMLWKALSDIGKSEYYEDTNLIGHLYWGWTLPNVMHLKESIITKYLKTQKVYYQIPPEERGRNSSLGTQYRLWRHLQLEGHECYMDEFKIAENADSIRTHHRLWRLMCEGANDPEIYYIN